MTGSHTEAHAKVLQEVLQEVLQGDLFITRIFDNPKFAKPARRSRSLSGAHFATNLEKIRFDKQLDNQKFAKELGISERTYRAIKKNGFARTRNVLEIAANLGMSAEQLLDHKL
jgi:hypothetical protein